MEKCTDINILLNEIKKLKQSSWYKQYMERKEALEIVEELCVKQAPIVKAIPEIEVLINEKF